MRFSFAWPPVMTELGYALRGLRDWTARLVDHESPLAEPVVRVTEAFQDRILLAQKYHQARRATLAGLARSVTVISAALFELVHNKAAEQDEVGSLIAVLKGALQIWPPDAAPSLEGGIGRLAEILVEVEGRAKLATKKDESTSVKVGALRQAVDAGRPITTPVVLTARGTRPVDGPERSGDGGTYVSDLDTTGSVAEVGARDDAAAVVVDEEADDGGVWARYEAGVSHDVSRAERSEGASVLPADVAWEGDPDEPDSDVVAPPAEPALALEPAIASALARASEPRVELSAPGVPVDPTQALMLEIARVTPTLNGSRIVARISDVVFPVVNGDWKDFLRQVARQLEARWPQMPVRLELRGYVGDEEFAIEVEKQAGENWITIMPLPSMGPTVRGHVNSFLPRGLDF